MSEVTALKAGLLADIEGAHNLAQVEELRVGALGKSGVVTALLKTLGAMSPEERKARALRTVKNRGAWLTSGSGSNEDQ